MDILSLAKTCINVIGACIMQKKQAFTTIQPAQCLGIKYKMEASELIRKSTDHNSRAKPGHLVFNSLIDMSVNLRKAFASEWFSQDGN